MTRNYIGHCWISESRLRCLWLPGRSSALQCWQKVSSSKQTQMKAASNTHTTIDRLSSSHSVNFHFFSSNWEVHDMCSHWIRSAFFFFVAASFHMHTKTKEQRASLVYTQWYNEKRTRIKKTRITSTLMLILMRLRSKHQINIIVWAVVAAYIRRVCVYVLDCCTAFDAIECIHFMGHAYIGCLDAPLGIS